MNDLECTAELDAELLSPAGNWDCARAAVENGADAIYFGLSAGFNARARAENFSLDDLPALMEYLHLHDVRGYVTLNTLVFSDELERVEEHAIAMANAGVDAVLVQDLGAARLIRKTCPDLELHASTQMTLTSAAGIKVADELGLTRVVLPRELSVSEISEIAAADSPVELEAFVHGALCVAYSGQCLTSESLGGRSANRGQCAQACRLPYEIICDGQDVELGDVQYLLSPQDLAAHALIPEMLAAGVRSFKIEGRLKTPEYVANVTKHYRMALDAALEERAFSLDKEQVEELELSFSRGFSNGWLGGIDHKMLVPGLSSAKRGVRIGTVRTIRGNQVVLNLDGRLRVGDGVAFAGDRAAGEEQGGRVFALYRDGQRTNETVDGGMVEIEFHGDSMDLDAVHSGQVVWKTDDPQLTRRLRATYSNSVKGDTQRRVPVDMKVTASEGKPLRVQVVAENGRRCVVSSDDVLPLARKHPVTEDVLRDKLGRLGATVYELRKLTMTLNGQPMTPHSLLGEVRKKIIEGLESRPEQVTTIHRGQLEQAREQLIQLREQSSSRPEEASDLQLHVLCRRWEQLAPAIDAGAKSLYVEFADIREYRQAVELGRERGVRLYLATPRIEKPGEVGVFKSIAKQQPDGVLVRNVGGLDFFREQSVPCVADFSLNAANELTVELLKEWGAERVTPSYDLNRDQMLDLVKRAAVDQLEAVIHQHMPMFHMEHCVFCAVLSPGTNKTNCGRPCDDHLVQLRDRVGAEHPLHADVGCRNTLYNSVPQSAAEMFSQLKTQRVRHFRIELLENSANETGEVVRTYRQLLRGDLTGRDVWQKLQATNRVGVTRGTMEAGRDPLAIL